MASKLLLDDIMPRTFFTLVLPKIRIKDILQDFMSETLGTSPNMPDHGGFSFIDTASQLANDLIESLVVDVAVELDLQFGLDLNPLFNEFSTGLPVPFIQINHFDLNGALGINDWTTTIEFGGLEFSIAGAKALLSIYSTISPSPIRLSSASDFAGLISPDSDQQIIFHLGLDVVFPIFLVYEGFGVGSRIEYLCVVVLAFCALFVPYALSNFLL